ncbi:B- and T-lymphocyte attenuator isoform X2 [Carcharodon carcharias]|nr:B- and T-lymphocyte attenuator isoform X2 [Carcharodon carcharias]
MLTYSVGDSLTLNCTIWHCTGRPEIHWCKIISDKCLPLSEANTKRTTPNDTNNKTVVVYTISSVNLTDSGIYQCHATEMTVSSKGNSITVNVFESKGHISENNSTETPTNSTMKTSDPLSTPIWIFYSIIVIGILGTVLFLVLITYFCIRNFNEPQETREPTDNCRRNEGHAMTEINDKSTIYENTNECSEDTGSAIPNSLTVNNCNSPGNHGNETCFSKTAPNNTIIYASLNTSMLCRKSSITIPNEEDTEYAAIFIKN